jgi:hypothetical protein
VTPQPPSGALINAILEHADVRHDLGEGRVLLRLSRRGIRKAAIRRRLGREAGRLEEVSLVWDDEAGQIIRVCDDAESSSQVDWAEPSESDRFELTEAGLAYLASFEAEWRP